MPDEHGGHQSLMDIYADGFQVEAQAAARSAFQARGHCGVFGAGYDLLVYADHQRVVRRPEVQANPIALLLDEERVVGQLKAFGARRLQPEELEIWATMALEMPVSAATVRTLQCVEPLAGKVCGVVLIQCATRSSSMVRGLPGRTSSYRPGMRRSMNLVRHLSTVAFVRSSRSAMALLSSPSALPRMIRARALRAAGSDRLCANDRSCERSSSVTSNSTFGLPVLTAVSPSPRYRIGHVRSVPETNGTGHWMDSVVRQVTTLMVRVVKAQSHRHPSLKPAIAFPAESASLRVAAVVVSESPGRDIRDELNRKGDGHAARAIARHPAPTRSLSESQKRYSRAQDGDT